jgi:hypothetical protein
MLGVEQWAEIRLMREVEGLSIREIAAALAATGTRSVPRSARLSRRAIAVARAVRSSTRTRRRSTRC